MGINPPSSFSSLFVWPPFLLFSLFSLHQSSVRPSLASRAPVVVKTPNLRVGTLDPLRAWHLQ